MRGKDKEWIAFLEKCLRVTGMQEALLFYETFWTYAEREDFPKRVRIVEELLKGELTQREIARTLKVSIANVTRGANVIKATNPSLKKLMDKINKVK